MDTYTPTRPIMTADELRSHHIEAHGRDYTLADDGYDEMAVNESRGWTTHSGWGRDGWDLGDWPYVVISTRENGGKFQLLSVCEGDHDVYGFASESDLNAAIDYLFIWYGMSREYDAWAVHGLTYDKREALDAGTLRVPIEFRGPFSWARLDACKADA